MTAATPAADVLVRGLRRVRALAVAQLEASLEEADRTGDVGADAAVRAELEAVLAWLAAGVMALDPLGARPTPAGALPAVGEAPRRAAVPDGYCDRCREWIGGEGHERTCDECLEDPDA